MRTRLDREFSAVPGRNRYEEGRKLMTMAAERIAEKYNLSILCMLSSQGQPDHSMHIQNMSVETMASFIVSLVTESKNREFTKRFLAKVPDRIWIRALGLRFALFYMAMGAGIWAGLEMLIDFLRRTTVN